MLISALENFLRGLKNTFSSKNPHFLEFLSENFDSSKPYPGCEELIPPLELSANLASKKLHVPISNSIAFLDQPQGVWDISCCENIEIKHNKAITQVAE